MRKVFLSVVFGMFAFAAFAQKGEWDSAFVKYMSVSVKADDGTYKQSPKKKMPSNAIDLIGIKTDSSQVMFKVKLNGETEWVTRLFFIDKRVFEDHAYKLYYSNEQSEVVIYTPKLRRLSYWNGEVFENGEKKFVHLYY